MMDEHTRPNGVSIEKYFNNEIKHIREVVDILEKASRDALSLSAIEFHRRLDVLNGEAGKLSRMQETYVEKIKEESDIDKLNTRMDGLKDALTELAKSFSIYKAGLEGAASRSNWISVVALLLAAISLLLRWLGK